MGFSGRRGRGMVVVVEVGVGVGDMAPVVLPGFGCSLAGELGNGVLGKNCRLGSL